MPFARWRVSCRHLRPPQRAAKVSVLASSSSMTCQAEQPPAKPIRDSWRYPGGACTWRIALGGRGLPQGLGSAWVEASRHPAVAFKRVLRLMRHLLSPLIAPNWRRGWPDGEIITHAPPHDRRFARHRRLGLDLHRRSAIGRRACPGMLQARQSLGRPAGISMGLGRAVWLAGAAFTTGPLRMDFLSDHFTNQIKFWGIQPSYAFVAEPQTNGVAERFNRTLKEQIIRSHLPQHRGAAGRRPRLRRTLQCPVDRRKERLPVLLGFD